MRQTGGEREKGWGKAWVETIGSKSRVPFVQVQFDPPALSHRASYAQTGGNVLVLPRSRDVSHLHSLLLPKQTISVLSRSSKISSRITPRSGKTKRERTTTRFRDSAGKSGENSREVREKRRRNVDRRGVNSRRIGADWPCPIFFRVRGVRSRGFSFRACPGNA